jgi:Tol biopolymer transport system component
VIDEQDLEQAERVFAPPAGSFDRFIRYRNRKRRNQRIAAGVVGIAVFVGAVWIVATAGSFDRTQTPAAPGPSVSVPRALEVDYVIDLNTGMMTPLPEAIIRSLGEVRPHTYGGFAASPGDSTLAYVAPDDEGRFQIFVAKLDGSRIRQVTYDPVEANSPAWSPDGMRIAYEGYSSGGARGLFVLDVATGEATKVIDVPKPGASPTFTPDGSSIVYTGGTNQQPGLRIVPVTGGPSSLLVEPGGGIADSGNGSISPDGSRVTYLGGGFPESGEVGHCGPCRFVANVDGTKRRVIPGWMANPAGTWSPDSSRIVTGTTYPNGAIWVIDVATGEKAEVARGRMAIWLDDHTLLVEV